MRGSSSDQADLLAGLEHASASSEDAVLLVRGGARPTIAWLNRTAGRLLGRDTADGVVLGDLLRSASDAELLHPVRTRPGDGLLRLPDGGESPVRVLSRPVPGHDLWVVSLRLDATAARGPDPDGQALAWEHRLLALTEQTPVPTVLSDVGLRLAHVNDAFARMVGLPAEAALGTSWLDLVHALDVDAVRGCAERALEGSPAEVVARFRTASGGRRWVHLRLAPAHTPGHGPGFVGTAEDVTERRAFEERLSYQARHDALTGLPNRAALFEQLQACLAGDGSGEAGEPSFAVLYLDLDNFKMINDSLGHDAGDALLVDVARRLGRVVRGRDLVARIGGDEFVVVCHDVPDDARAELLARRVLEVCTEPVEVASVLVHPSASLGVARATADHTGAQDLLRDADIAMYQAKRGGRNRFAVCDAAARAAAGDTLRLLADLRRAIDQGELTVAYQPVVGIGSPAAGDAGTDVSPLLAVEALSRWTHPTRGPVSPEVFVRLAEEHQLVVPLTARVLEAACSQMARWQVELGALAPRRVNVNLSAVQVTDLRLVGQVREALRRHGLPPSALCLEITESAIMGDPTASRDTLLALRELGVSVAIDDFGVGYSSLAYLRRLPVDHLKIDRSFVDELGTGTGGAIAAVVVELARALGLSAIAEGVETPEQAHHLQQLGCTLGQGWLWAPAMDGDELREWVLRRAGLLDDPVGALTAELAR